MFHDRRNAVVWFVCFFGAGVFCNLAMANEREWTSADGKRTITAELVSATSDSVTLKRNNGKTAKVPLSKFSPEDREFVQAYLVKRDQEETERAIKGRIARFYQVIRKAPELEDLKTVLVTAARENVDSNSAFFEKISTPDRGKKAVVRQIDFDGDRAVAQVSIKISGSFRKLEFGLRDESGTWNIESLTYETESGGKMMMEFVEAKEVDPASIVAATPTGTPPSTDPIAGVADGEATTAAMAATSETAATAKATPAAESVSTESPPHAAPPRPDEAVAAAAEPTSTSSTTDEESQGSDGSESAPTGQEQPAAEQPKPTSHGHGHGHGHQ